jgi:hypothetical protein
MTEEVVQFLLKLYLLQSVLFAAVARSLKTKALTVYYTTNDIKLLVVTIMPTLLLISFFYVQKYSRIFIRDN